MLLKAVHRFPDYSLLVVQETQLQESVGLGWLIPLLIRYVKQVLQMLDCLVHVTVLRVRLSQLLVSLSCFCFVISLLAKNQKFVQHLY